MIKKHEWLDIIANNFHVMLGENTPEMSMH